MCWNKITKAIFSWLTNNAAEVALSIDGGEKKYDAGGWVHYCEAAFLFHDSELTHKGPLTAIVADHAETVSTEGPFKKGVEARITQQNIDSRLNQTEPCLAGQVYNIWFYLNSPF